MIYSIDRTSVGLNSRCEHKVNVTESLLVIFFFYLCLLGQPDAEYFRIDRPNSGEVILAKPLDYETKTFLTVTIHATVSIGKTKQKFPELCKLQIQKSDCPNRQEMSTTEQFNTSVSVNITVLDADDQYPQFLPCVLLYQDETSRICTSPVYTVNVTEGEQVTA